MMASTFAVPLMSTVDSSQYVHGHSHKRSHQRSSQRLTPPFVLPRIPSERLDRRSVHYDENLRVRENGEKNEEQLSMNCASAGAQRSINAPSLSPDEQLKGILKREATTHNPKASGSLQSQGYRYPHVDTKAETRAGKMHSKSR
jgi:hypothetical protein